MGNATAGFSSTISVSTTDGSYTEVSGANSVDNSRSRETLDATDFSDAAFTRVMGLKDVSFSISGNYQDADVAQGEIETALSDGSDLYVQFLVDGTNGYKAACKVESFDISSTPDGKVEFSAEFVGNAASTGWTAV